MMPVPPPQGQPIAPQQGPQQGPPPVTIDAVVQLLRDDRMRGFRIDIETDSLVEADQTQERKDRTDFVTAIGGFFKEFGPVVQQMPPLAPLAGQLLQFAVRGFKVGAEMEESIEKAMAGVAAHLANPPPPMPRPEDQAKLAVAQQKGQAEIQKATIGVQAAQTKAQAETAKAQLDAHHATKEDERKAALHELEVAAAKIAHEHDMNARQLEMARADQIHKLTIDKMHHEAGIKAQSAEHDIALKKDATSHDMALKEKQATGGEEKQKADTEGKSRLEKLFGEIGDALKAKKKIVRDGKGEIVAIEHTK